MYFIYYILVKLLLLPYTTQYNMRDNIYFLYTFYILTLFQLKSSFILNTYITIKMMQHNQLVKCKESLLTN